MYILCRSDAHILQRLLLFYNRQILNLIGFMLYAIIRAGRYIYIYTWGHFYDALCITIRAATNDFDSRLICRLHLKCLDLFIFFLSFRRRCLQLWALSSWWWALPPSPYSGWLGTVVCEDTNRHQDSSAVRMHTEAHTLSLTIPSNMNL